MTQCAVPAVPQQRPRRGRPATKADELLALVEASGGGLTVKELAALTGMTSSAVQQFYYRYERAGLLVKREATWRLR